MSQEKQPHHVSKELPVTKVHLHLFLQVVQVTLRQHPTIHVSLQSKMRATLGLLSDYQYLYIISRTGSI